MGKRRGAESKRREGKIKTHLTCTARPRRDAGTRESRRLRVSHLKGSCRLCTRDAGSSEATDYFGRIIQSVAKMPIVTNPTPTIRANTSADRRAFSPN